MSQNRADAILELLNMIMKPSNLRKKKYKGTTIYDKRTVKCYIGIAQCDNGTIKYEKKIIRKPPNIRKELSNIMLEPHNVKMEPSNVRKK